MKTIYFLIVTLMTFKCAGQTLLLRGPNVDIDSYSNFIRGHGEYISIDQWYKHELEKKSVKEKLLFTLIDLPHSDIEKGLEIIHQVQSDSAFSPTALLFISDWTQLVLEKNNMRNSEPQRLNCLVRSLLKKQIDDVACKINWISIDTDLKELGPIEVVFVESTQFSPDERIPIIKNQTYNWTFISSGHEPIRFFGTIEELMKTNLKWISIVSGSCKNWSNQTQNYELLNQGQIFFSENCIESLLTDTKPASWIEQNKYSIGSGILAFLGAAYLLRGKTVIIHPITF